MRKALGRKYGNNHCRDHRAVSLRLSARGNDSSGKILRSICKHPVDSTRALSVALALITKPMGLYLMQVLDANGRTWLDPVLRPLERLTYRLMGVMPNKEHDWKQYTLAMLLFSLVAACSPMPSCGCNNLLPLNPQGLRPGDAGPRLQYGSQFHHQHQLAELRRRIDHVVLLADGRPGVSQFRLGRDRHRHRRGAGARHRAAFGANARQLLGRSGARHLLPAAADLPGLRGVPRVAGHDPKLQALHEGEARRAVEGPGREEERQRRDGQRTQTAKPVMEEQTVTEQIIVQGPMASQVAIKMLGHQWRRLHERQRGASVREPDAALELPPDAFDLRDRQRADLLPRPNGEEPEARLGGVGGDDGAVSRRSAALLVGGSGRQSDPSAISASLPPTATWKARKSASAFSIPRSSPRSPRTLPAARSTRCTIRSRRSAGSFRCSTSSSGEIIFGGVGAGLYGMLVFVVLAVFIAGLMVGRTPEYLGKKIEAYEVKMAMLSLLDSGDLDSRFLRLGRREQMGLGRAEQHRPARLERNSLRLQFRHGQQRQRLCRTDREHALV